MSKRNFSDFIEAYLQYTSGHEATRKCHLWSIISVIAGALERKVWMNRGYYILYPNLYVFIIGKSGLVKKSTTTGIAVNLLRECKVKLMSERVTAASLIKQLHSSGREFEWNGRKIKQSAVFCYSSELSVFLNEVFGSTHELLTTFYDCTPSDSSKPWVYELRHSETMKIYGPCLNMLGASTKAWLKKSIPGTEMEAGFASRIVFVVENQGPENLVAWPEVSPRVDTMKQQLIEDLQHISSLIGSFDVTPRAKQLFTDWYHFHMKHVIPQNMDPKFSGYMGRKGDLMLKLAMIRSVSLRSDLTLHDTDVLWAGENLEELEPEMKSTFEGSGSHSRGDFIFEVRNYVRQRGKVEIAELRRTFAGDLPGVLLDQAIQNLTQMEYIHMSEETKDGVKVKFIESTGHKISEIYQKGL